MAFIEPCFGIGHNLSLICLMTSEDIKHQLIIIIRKTKARGEKRKRKKRRKKARVIFRSSKYDHVSPPLHRFHWLPICHRIYYNHSPIYFSSLTGLGPQKRADIIKIYVSSRQLRSSSDTPLSNPFCRNKVYEPTLFCT